MLAQGLGEIQARHDGVDIGSYPSYSSVGFGVAVVLRHTDPAALDATAVEVVALIRALGGEPEEQDI